MELQLRAARIPFIGQLAHHYWLVAVRDGEPERWEIWQWQNAGGESWGHLHRNLLAFDSGVGNGPSWVAHRWYGAAAVKLAARLAQAPDTYPWRHRYLPWPGPNSNTFVRWVIGDQRLMGWQALGKHYPVWRVRALDDDSARLRASYRFTKSLDEPASVERRGGAPPAGNRRTPEPA